MRDNTMIKPEDPAFRKFIQFVARAVDPLEISQAVIDRLAETAVLRTVEKGAHILEADEIAEQLFFISAGLIRYYYIDERGGEERTGQFFDVDTVYTDVTSFVSQTRSRQYIQALESSVIICISRKIIYEAYVSDHAIERFGRLMLEQALIGSQQRTSSFMSESVEERYRRLMGGRQDLAQRVPQYILATYLGITPEALSRIRRRSTQACRPKAAVRSALA
jgi:CRP-like cAMP-binding protein